MTHNIKILENVADAIVNGDNKTFGVRKNNRSYQKGNIIQFTAVNSNGIKIHTHPINDKKYIITDVLTGWWLKWNIVAFSIIPNVDDYDNGFTECKERNDVKTEFCPNCGADMRGETE